MLLNETGELGIFLQLMTLNLTGSLFLSLLFLVIGVIVVFAAFRIPIEATMIIVIPLLITIMAYTSEFLPVGGLIIIYVAFLFAKNFVIK
jgi:hypothetical protein